MSLLLSCDNLAFQKVMLDRRFCLQSILEILIPIASIILQILLPSGSMLQLHHSTFQAIKNPVFHAHTKYFNMPQHFIYTSSNLNRETVIQSSPHARYLGACVELNLLSFLFF